MSASASVVSVERDKDLRAYGEFWAEFDQRVGEQDWHLSYPVVRELLSPYLERAATDTAANGVASVRDEDGDRPRVVDVGCGTSSFSRLLFDDIVAVAVPSTSGASPASASKPPAVSGENRGGGGQGGSLVLVDAAEPLVDRLRTRHASDARVYCAVADCRNLVQGLEGIVKPGSADVVLEKGTLNALDSEAEMASTMAGAASLLRRPAGLFISISFATAAMILFYQRQASALGLQLRLRVLSQDGKSNVSHQGGNVGEVRLVALFSDSFGAVADDVAANSLTVRHIGHLLYSRPLFKEPSITFENPVLPEPVTVEQHMSASEEWDVGADDATGAVVWPVTFNAAAYLCQEAERVVRGRRVFDLGSGTGLLGIVAAAAGARDVVLTDIAAAMPLLRGNVALNAASCDGRVRVAELRWGAADAAALAAACSTGDSGCGDGLGNLVLACDVVYQLEEETQIELVDTIEALMGAGGTCCVFYQHRGAFVEDSSFFLAAQERFHVETIDLLSFGYGASADEEEARMAFVYRARLAVA
eukprot:TRINITY_DN20100_c0_g1_i1.p1 TRINITY_DN20100_c0_g1~~TRINITY_DN20100_c0_g1_i1.p1  ORF type:complete len:540 (-),score=94.54 TRINITY_DN20100_c0_g1_i1:131-1729(-)